MQTLRSNHLKIEMDRGGREADYFQQDLKYLMVLKGAEIKNSEVKEVIFFKNSLY